MSCGQFSTLVPALCRVCDPAGTDPGAVAGICSDEECQIAAVRASEAQSGQNDGHDLEEGPARQ